MKVFSALVIVLLGWLMAAPRPQGTDEPTLMYAQYISPNESHLVRQQRGAEAPTLEYVIEYPGPLDFLLASPLNGVYYVFDGQVNTRSGDDFTAQWPFPMTDDVADIFRKTVNHTDFDTQTGTLIINNAALSPTEDRIAFDLTSVSEGRSLVYEFIALYDRAADRFQLIEIEDRSLNSIVSVGNMRWSPDGETLAYAYPTQDRVDTEHITLVTGCTRDIMAACEVTRLQLPAERPYLRTFDWSPDGTRFAYSCAENHLASHEICVINQDGRGLTTYITAETYKDDLHWSPDGKMLAYAGYPPGNQEQDIYLLDLESGDETNFSNSPGVLESSPFWLTVGP